MRFIRSRTVRLIPVIVPELWGGGCSLGGRMYRHWVLTTCFGSSGEIDWWRQIAAGNPMWAKHTRPSSVHPFPGKQIHLALIVKWLKKMQSSFYSRIVFLSWVSLCLYNHCVDNCFSGRSTCLLWCQQQNWLRETPKDYLPLSSVVAPHDSRSRRKTWKEKYFGFKGFFVIRSKG